jgi:hypothetical protein
LVANGLYLGVGVFSGVGDAGDLLRFGCPPWVLVAFGVMTAPAGLYLWHGLGPHFGLGTSKDVVERRAAIGVPVLLALVVVVEVLMFREP